MVTQCRTFVVGAEASTLLQDWDDRVGESVEATRGEMRHQDETVGGVGLDEQVDLIRDRLRGTDE